MDRDDVDEWRNAELQELKSIQQNNIWSLIELPAGRKHISCKRNQPQSVRSPCVH